MRSLNFFRKLLGNDCKKDDLVNLKREEAHVIKNEMTKDILHVQRKIDKVNKDTNNKLNEISVDLKNITYHIAVATGGKKRGLR
jgi:hypothetical protein